MRRKVLHLIDTGGPGGAETVFRNLVTGLGENWESVAAVPDLDWLYDSLRAADVEPVIVPTHGRFDLRYLHRLVRLCRSGTALVHAHLLTSSVYGAVAGAFTGIPVVCTFHGVADLWDQSRLLDLKFRILAGIANAHIVFVSEPLRRAFLEAVPLKAARTSVIHNGIDTDRFHPGRDNSLRRELGVSRDDILVGAVGNVRPSKAYDVLLRAAAILRTVSPRYRFVVVGQPSRGLSERLMALHSELGLGESFCFAGLRDDIPSVMRNLDIYVSSSSAEGFSLTTVEAMACGVPVVATRSGGPEDILKDGVNGRLVPSNAPAALAEAIGAITSDPELAQRFRAAAREVALQRFTMKAMIINYQALYERCLAQPGWLRSTARPAARRQPSV